MAGDALRRGPAKVASPVAIHARQCAVLAIQIAANFRVVELRRGERPLVVAGTATRGERVRVDVILSVAVDAQVTGARKAPIVDVTAIAALLIVGTFELEVTDVVKRNNVREGVGGVAGLANCAELALVYLRLWVARALAIAVRGARLECHAGMTIGAANRQVLAGQNVVTLRVVVEDILARLQVTALAFLA